MSAEQPDNLIKYCDVKAAEQILSSKSLRWSSPEVFGDPFELSSQLDLGFDNTSLLDSTIKLASSMIFAPEQPKGDSPLINAIKRWREEERFATPEEAYDVLQELLRKMVEYRAEQLNGNLGKWQEYVRTVRVCCFCSKPDNVVAWEKFANRHQGIAIRFAKAEDGDNAVIANPNRILYQADRPQITTLREQLGAVLHNKSDDILGRFKDHYFSKAPHHKLEREWRCIRTSTKNIPVSNNQPKEWTDDIIFDPKEVTGIFFGLSTADETKKRVTKIVKEHYKHAKLFQMVAAKSGYNIESEKI